MIIVFSVIALIIALLGIIFFGCSVLWSVLTIFAAVVMIILQILLKKKLTPVLKTIIGVAETVILIVLMLCINQKEYNSGIYSYSEELNEMKAMVSEDPDRAIKKLKRLEEKYGSDDKILALYVTLNTVLGDYKTAYEYSEMFNDKTSESYYKQMEFLYLSDDTRDTTEDLYSLYLDAARQWPDWAYMQQMAGISKFEQDSFVSAEYYLLRAYSLDSENVLINYYLGAVNFKQGEYELCKEYFNDALKYGANDKIKSEILWYIQQINE